MHPRRYETLLLTDPDIPQEEQDLVRQKIFDIITNMDGRLIRTEDWGRRRLAYPVKKKMYGAYFLIDFMGSPNMLEEMERNLRIDERVYKYMSQILDKSFTEEKFQQEMERLDAEKARIEAERARREMEAAAAHEERDEDRSDQPRTEVPAEAKPEAEPEVKPEPEAEPEPEVKPEPEVAPEPEVKPEPEVAPEAPAEAEEQAEAPVEEPKPEPQGDAS